MSDGPDTYSDLNDTQKSRIDEVQSALGGNNPPRLGRRQRRSRSMRYNAALAAYVDDSGDLYVSTGDGDGRVQKVRQLNSEQREMLSGGGGPSSWRKIRRRYGVEGGDR
jgi:hypothetical protein